jgi:outer membrane immunogenic protein
VLGFEADIQDGDIKDSKTWALATSTSQITAFGTVRGRIGFAIDNVLIYSTGGWAEGHVNNSEVGNNAFKVSTDSSGWVVGGGVEWAFAPKWSVKAEYQHIELGRNVPLTANGVPPVGLLVHRDEFDSVRVGVNYKLW